MVVFQKRMKPVPEVLRRSESSREKATLSTTSLKAFVWKVMRLFWKWTWDGVGRGRGVSESGWV